MIGWIVLIVVVVVFIAIQHSDESTKPRSNYVATEKGGVNNPGYLIRTDIKWLGCNKGVNSRFENFETLSYGVRAWCINLFQKVKKGTIRNTSQMIDVLTPAGSDNPEDARNNYKASVARATNWVSLCRAVFDFEANPDWINAKSSDKNKALAEGLGEAVRYCYNGEIPPYFS